MKRNSARIVYSMLMCSAMLYSCNTDQLVSEPETSGTSLTLTPQVPQSIIVKSTPDADDKISHVWMIQLDGSGNVVTSNGNKLIEGITLLDKNYDGKSYTLNETLDISTKKVYFIANAPGETSFGSVSNESEILEKTADVLTSGISASNGIIMTGVWATGDDYDIEMYRAIAKIDAEFNLQMQQNSD